jgi:hypothetical protein
VKAELSLAMQSHMLPSHLLHGVEQPTKVCMKISAGKKTKKNPIIGVSAVVATEKCRKPISNSSTAPRQDIAAKAKIEVAQNLTIIITTKLPTSKGFSRKFGTNVWTADS